MRRPLHLGVNKALGVVPSHYQVDFEVCPRATSSRSASKTRRR
jgi:hypothetical protein